MRTVLRISARAAVLASLIASLSACTQPLVFSSSVTCAEFLDLSATDQQEATGSHAENQLILDLTPSGAKRVAPVDYLRTRCSAGQLSEIGVGYILSAASRPTCDGFLSSPPNVRLEWLSAMIPDDEDVDRGFSLDVATACLGGGELKEAVGRVRTGTESPDLILPIADFPHSLTWTTTSKSGNLVGGVLEVGDVIETGENPPWSTAGSSITAGDGCGYDPAKDAVVPARLVAMNRSSVPVRVSVAISITRSEQRGIMLAIDSGTYCDLEDEAGNLGLTIRSNSTTVQPGQTYPIAFFIMLKNYVGSDDAANALAGYTVEPFPAWIDGDNPVVDGPQDVALDLSVVGSGSRTSPTG